MSATRSPVFQWAEVIVIIPIQGCWVSRCAPGVNHVGTEPIDVPFWMKLA